MKRLSLLTFFLALGLANAQDNGSSGVDQNKAIIAHGFLLSLAFLIFFPLGAFSIRLLHLPHTAWIHGALQLFAYSMVTAGAGLGIWIAVTTQQLDVPHAIIGLTVFCLLTLQPIGGAVHHYIFKCENRSTWIGSIHRWLGRVLILLGAINGGLGLQLSANTVEGEIAYGAVAGVMFLIYVAVDVWSCVKDRRSAKGEETLGSGPQSPDRTMVNGSVEWVERVEMKV